MITRAQYMEEPSKLFRLYYGQFVTRDIKERVKTAIGLQALMNSRDEYLNDIPLAKWDQIAACPAEVAEALRARGDYPTLAGMVCIYKVAARQIIEEELAKVL